MSNPYESPHDAAKLPVKSLRAIERENEMLATIGCAVLLGIVAMFVAMGFAFSLFVWL